MTWTIIGSPAMSASGLPGSLDEAMRAGMRTRCIVVSRQAPALPAMLAKTPSGLGGYTGCQGRGKPGICAPPHLLARCAEPAFQLPSASLEAMDSFELNKILGAILGT